LRLFAKPPHPLAEVDLEAVESLRRDELVLVEDELVRLPS
jgi:hypothetical protein